MFVKNLKIGGVWMIILLISIEITIQICYNISIITERSHTAIGYKYGIY